MEDNLFDLTEYAHEVLVNESPEKLDFPEPPPPEPVAETLEPDEPDSGGEVQEGLIATPLSREPFPEFGFSSFSAQEPLTTLEPNETTTEQLSLEIPERRISEELPIRFPEFSPIQETGKFSYDETPLDADIYPEAIEGTLPGPPPLIESAFPPVAPLDLSQQAYQSAGDPDIDPMRDLILGVQDRHELSIQEIIERDALFKRMGDV